MKLKHIATLVIISMSLFVDKSHAANKPVVGYFIAWGIYGILVR